MRIITISREFGSGGRELGKRLADQLGFAYYDREIVESIAQSQGADPAFVEKTLDSQLWQSVPLHFHHSFSNLNGLQSLQTDLLLAQTKVLEKIAASGDDCIIVGRNADAILAKYDPFNIFVCADLDARIERCIARAEQNEDTDRKKIRQNIRRIDKARAQTRDIISGSKWGHRATYHLIVNTTGWNIKALTPAVAEFAQRWFARETNVSVEK